MNALSNDLFLVIGITEPTSGAVKVAKKGKCTRDRVSDRDKADEPTGIDVTPVAGVKGTLSVIEEKKLPPEIANTEPTALAIGNKKPLLEIANAEQIELVIWDKRLILNIADAEPLPPAGDKRIPLAINKALILANTSLARADNRLPPEMADEELLTTVVNGAQISVKEVVHAKVIFLCWRLRTFSTFFFAHSVSKSLRFGWGWLLLFGIAVARLNPNPKSNPTVLLFGNFVIRGVLSSR